MILRMSYIGRIMVLLVWKDPAIHGGTLCYTLLYVVLIATIAMCVLLLRYIALLSRYVTLRGSGGRRVGWRVVGWLVEVWHGSIAFLFRSAPYASESNQIKSNQLNQYKSRRIACHCLSLPVIALRRTDMYQDVIPMGYCNRILRWDIAMKWDACDWRSVQ